MKHNVDVVSGTHGNSLPRNSQLLLWRFVWRRGGVVAYVENRRCFRSHFGCAEKRLWRPWRWS